MAYARTATLPSPPPVRADQKLRIVYLAGSGHTGSTLLGLLLQAHPRVASVGGASVTRKIRQRGDVPMLACSCGALLTECTFWQGVFRRVREQGFSIDASNWSNDYRFENRLLHRLLTQHSSFRPVRLVQDWAADHLPVHKARMDRIGRVNVAFIRAVLEVGDADVLVDTSKRTMRLTRLLKLPELDVKVIRMVRDVRAYASSAKRRGHSITHASQSWVTTQHVIADITDRLPADRTLLLRYEDLCRDLEETLHRLYAFIGVDGIGPVTSVSAGEHHVIGNSMRLKGAIQVKLDESWRSRLTSEEQQRILGLAGPMNRALGYV